MRLDLIEWMVEADTSARMWRRAALLAVGWPVIPILAAGSGAVWLARRAAQARRKAALP